MIIKAEYFIAHYGVKGMKWGVRRSQAQLQRAAASRKAKRDPSTPEGAEIARRKSAKKNRRTLSDADIDALVDRLQKEKKLKELIDADVSPGSRVAKAIMSESGQKVARNVVAGAMTAAVAAKFGATVARGGMKK